MDGVAVLLVLLTAVAAGAIVAAPLRAGRAERDAAAHAAAIADLEAAKTARYREIREVEMDFRTGKLSEADWRASDRELRAEAMELLRRLDALGAETTVDESPEDVPAPQGPPEQAGTPGVAHDERSRVPAGPADEAGPPEATSPAAPRQA